MNDEEVEKFLAENQNKAQFDQVFQETGKKAKVVHALYSKLYEMKRFQERNTCKKIIKYLTVLKILMRERKEIEILLTSQAMNYFINLIYLEPENPYEKEFYDLHSEALKCMINSFYNRRDFILSFNKEVGMDRIFAMLNLQRSCTFYALLFKCLATICDETFIVTELTVKRNIFPFIISILAFATRDRLFPYGEDRLSVLLEIYKFLYILSAKKSTDTPYEKENFDYMTILGEASYQLISFPHYNQKLLELKIAIINLLSQSPESYIGYLLQRNIIHQIVSILQSQIELYNCDRTEESSKLVPAIMFLYRLSSYDKKVAQTIRETLFARKEIEKIAKQPSSEIPHCHSPRIKKSLGEEIISLMTCLNSSLKRCSSELIFLLCENDAKKFTNLTGIGNAVALLRSKGII